MKKTATALIGIAFICIKVWLSIFSIFKNKLNTFSFLNVMQRLRYFSLYLFCGLPLQLFAETSSKVEKINVVEPLSMMNMFNTVMGLLVVIAIILGLAWAMRKYGSLSISNQVDMKVLGGLSLGTREKAILIQVEGKKLLIGVAPGRVQTLHVLDDGAEADNEFNKKLNDALEAS